MAGALDSASELGVTTDGAARRALQPTISGQLLIGLGWLGIYVTLAIGFPDLWRQLGQKTRVPGGLRGRRRAMRQIEGKQPYLAHEIPHLRWLAERHVAARHWSATTWLTWISLLAFCAGFALKPPQFPPSSGDELVVYSLFIQVLQFMAQLLRPVTVVMALALVALIVAKLRMRNDARAEAFLERTQPDPWPTDEGRRPYST